MKRVGWDRYFLELALAVSARSTCPRRFVGAVIVGPDHAILGTGYNGAPRGMPHCSDVGCAMYRGHCIRTIHAEHNAIISALQRGPLPDGTSLYLTDRPCVECSKLIVQVGIKTVYYIYKEDPYEDSERMKAFDETFYVGHGFFELVDVLLAKGVP